MIPQNQFSFFQPAHRLRFLALLLAVALGGLTSLPTLAQPQAGVEYETRLFLPSAADPEVSLGVDEAVIRWILKPGTYAVDATITKADLEFLQLKLDDTSPENGGVIIDDIIVGGVETANNGRSPEDVLWEFVFFDPALPDYNSLLANIGPGELTRFRNIDEPDLDEGEIFFKIEHPVIPYEVVTYSAGDDRSWLTAQADALSRGGYLATITSADENTAVYNLVGPGQAWIGGFQDFSSCVPSQATCGWTWVNNEGPIPLTGEPGFSAWDLGEPNGSGEPATPEDYVTINLGNEPVWNDSRAIAGSNPTQYVIEYPNPVHVTRFTGDGETYFEELVIEPDLIQRTAVISTVSVRDIPTPVGDGTIFDIPTIEQEGLVVQSGLTNVDVCVAPDPREGFIIQGQGRQFKGKGKGSEKGKGVGNNNSDPKVTRVFNRKPLSVSSFAGTGTCTGPLPDVAPDDPYQTWEDLLAEIDLSYPEDYRGYVGRVDLTPETAGDEEDWVEAVWFMVVVVRSTAQFAGPVSVVNFPEELINYDQTPLGERPVNDVDGLFPACANDRSWRPVDLGGNVMAFDGTVDVEGSLIPKSVQCNRSWSLTRRTTHVVPGRLEGDVNWSSAEAIENDNLESQLAGLQATLMEAGAICSSLDPLLYGDLQSLLNQAESAFADQAYADAVSFLEVFAQVALDEGPSGDIPGTGFDSCPIVDNVPGNLVARGLAASFTIFDRFINGDNYALYDPAILEELTPDLREEEAPVIE